MSNSKLLLDVEDLNICFYAEDIATPALGDVNNVVYPGEITGFVSEPCDGGNMTSPLTISSFLKRRQNDLAKFHWLTRTEWSS